VSPTPVPPISSHSGVDVPSYADRPRTFSSQRRHALDADQIELARQAAAIKSVQDRTVAKTEQLVARMSERPPAFSSHR
jgi:hypothetical protein